MSPNSVAHEDPELVRLLDRSVGEVRLSRGAEQVASRGRALRRRKRALPTVAAVGVLAAALGIAAVARGGSAPAHTPARAGGAAFAAGGEVVDIDAAAYSVRTDAATGVVTVTLKQAGDPSRLQAVLRKAGIPLAIEIRPLSEMACSWVGAVRVETPSDVVTSPTLDGGGHMTGSSTISFIPAHLPEGEVIGVVYGVSGGKPVAWYISALSTWPKGCSPTS